MRTFNFRGCDSYTVLNALHSATRFDWYYRVGKLGSCRDKAELGVAEHVKALNASKAVPADHTGVETLPGTEAIPRILLLQFPSANDPGHNLIR